MIKTGDRFIISADHVEVKEKVGCDTIATVIGTTYHPRTGAISFICQVYDEEHNPVCALEIPDKEILDYVVQMIVDDGNL